MFVIHAANVHHALDQGLQLLDRHGITRDSRNGPVVMAPGPVTTVYAFPCERVLHWAARDANPFFHLYESLWMLAGRKDITPLTKYSKNIANYSDDGLTQHAAYGYRWRHWMAETGFNLDQLGHIAERLAKDPNDRRSVLQMWDPNLDLNKVGKDFPCNLSVTFQRDTNGHLDMTVFNRSNDIIWGAYGANAVHFSMLQEYMATWIGCPVGKYNQISVNYHAYQEVLAPLMKEWKTHGMPSDRYQTIRPLPMPSSIEEVDRTVSQILHYADKDTMQFGHEPPMFGAWGSNLWLALQAHEAFRDKDNPDRFRNAYAILDRGILCDWNSAAREWLQRREAKMENRKTQVGFYPSSRYGSKL